MPPTSHLLGEPETQVGLKDFCCQNGKARSVSGLVKLARDLTRPILPPNFGSFLVSGNPHIFREIEVGGI